MKALIDADIPSYSIAFRYPDGCIEELEMAVDKHIQDILKATGADSYQCYLTGDKCNRREKYPDYKGNRKTEKPEHWEAVRNIFINDFDAIITDDGREADDWIAECQTNQILCPVSDDNGVIACSSDKDFNTFPGWHYNPKWDCKYWVTEEDADLWFWCQMVMGDTADNIKGIPRKGKKWCEEHLYNAEDPKLAVIAAYRNHFGESFEEEYNKNYYLLRIG